MMAQMQFIDPPMPDIIDQWKFYLSLLQPRAEDNIIDIGCGTGHAAMLLLQEYPAIGKIVGIDNAPENYKIALNFWEINGSPAKIEFGIAGADKLPFPDNYFDRAICAEMLEYSEKPATAISEIYRVLKQGSIAVIIHSDFDTQVFHSGDRKRTREIIRAFSDAGPNGQMGRELYGLCRKAGFSSVEPLIYPFISTIWEPQTYSYNITQMMVEWIEQRQLLPSIDLKEWLSDLARVYSMGYFYYSINRYICRCVK